MGAWMQSKSAHTIFRERRLERGKPGRELSVRTTLNNLFLTPIVSRQQWGLIGLIALAFIAMPQLDYNDWERNTEGLFDGLRIYHNPNAVYPPWALILLWPYYLLTSPGSRVASVLVVGWLAARRRWTVATFLSIVFSPFFIWTMLLSNIDVLALLLPVVLWESTRHTRWQSLGWSVSRGVYPDGYRSF